MAKIVCVTSCITGIAHTYMAAEALEQAGKKMGHDLVVETQGSAGSNPLKQAVIDAADAVIFAVDLEVKDRDRFAGKPYIELPVAKAMKDAPGVITQILDAVANGTAAKVSGTAPAAASKEQPAASDAKSGEKKGGFLGGLFGKK
jgi:PTS system fructose-specific IIC component